jgi:dimethylargininase
LKGRELFVGLSQRTNESGARAVAAAFPEFPVTPIRIPNKLLHLKTCMSMAGPDILCVSSSQEAQEILRVSFKC